MPDANRVRRTPHLNKEQAEAHHDEIAEALEQTAEAEAQRTPAIPRADAGDEQQGITNQPVEEEVRQQDKLPPRGERKGGSHA